MGKQNEETRRHRSKKPKVNGRPRGGHQATVYSRPKTGSPMQGKEDQNNKESRTKEKKEHHQGINYKVRVKRPSTTTNHATGTPVMKIFTSASRPKALEKQRQVKPYPRFNILNDYHSTRAHITKVEIIAGQPNTILANIEDIKDTGDTTELIRAETKESMAT